MFGSLSVAKKEVSTGKGFNRQKIFLKLAIVFYIWFSVCSRKYSQLKLLSEFLGLGFRVLGLVSTLLSSYLLSL